VGRDRRGGGAGGGGGTLPFLTPYEAQWSGVQPYLSFPLMVALTPLFLRRSWREEEGGREEEEEEEGGGGGRRREEGGSRIMGRFCVLVVVGVVVADSITC